MLTCSSCTFNHGLFLDNNKLFRFQHLAKLAKDMDIQIGLEARIQIFRLRNKAQYLTAVC